MHNLGEFDCTDFGHAVKAGRISMGWTQEHLAEMLDVTTRYVISLENKGQHPSLQVFYKLATLFQISVDQFFFPDTGHAKSPHRRQVDSILDALDDNQLAVIEATATALRQSRSE